MSEEETTAKKVLDRFTQDEVLKGLQVKLQALYGTKVSRAKAHDTVQVVFNHLAEKANEKMFVVSSVGSFKTSVLPKKFAEGTVRRLRFKAAAVLNKKLNGEMGWDEPVVEAAPEAAAAAAPAEATPAAPAAPAV